MNYEKTIKDIKSGKTVQMSYMDLVNFMMELNCTGLKLNYSVSEIPDSKHVKIKLKEVK